MNTNENERLVVLAASLDEYVAARTRGDTFSLEAYRDHLGEFFDDFVELVASEHGGEMAELPAAIGELPREWGTDYVLERELGHGAMGIVYEAVDRRSGRRVALKVLRSGAAGNATSRARFRREAEALARVSHPHVVEFLEAGEFEGRPFFVMTLVEGRDLESVLAAKTPPPIELVARGLADVADAIHTLHEAGLLHRDVKPSNIMVRPDGRMVLTDFGLARGSDLLTLTQSTALLGTPAYMSPEQLLGVRTGIDARSDIYGLGATLYRALAGGPPFEQAKSLQELTQRVLRERPPHPRRLRPDVPRACERIALMCLEKDPSDRYASAAELRDDLRAFAEGKRVSGKPVPAMRLGLRAARRHPWWVAAALLVAVGAAYLLFRVDPSYLTLDVVPAARVSLNGEVVGPTPLAAMQLAPETPHTLIVNPVDERFRAREETFTPGEGARYDWRWLLEPRDPNDWSSVQLLAQALQLPHASPIAHVGRRAGDRPPLQILGPRGRLRPRDLDATGAWIVFGDQELDLPGTIVFRRGGEVLATIEEWDSEDMESIVPFPDAVKESIRPGDSIQVEVRDAGLPPIVAAFDVVSDDVADAGLARIDSETAGFADPASQARLRTILRTRLLLEHGLAWAAWHEIRPVSAEGTHLLPLALEQEALFALLPETDLREGVARWHEVSDAIHDADRWEAAERNQVFGEDAPSR